MGRDLFDQGFEVFGLCRRTATAEKLNALKITPLQIDLLDPEALAGIPDMDYVIACQAPSRESDTFENTYVTATQNLMNALSCMKLKQFILISSTSVYGDRKGEWVDEKTVIRSNEFNLTQSAQSLVRAEESVMNSDLPWVILRLSGIYGPHRHRLKRLQSGEFQPPMLDDFMNRIHRDDIIGIINMLIQKKVSQEVIVGSDDLPTTHKQFYTWIFQELGMELPFPQSDSKKSRRGSKRCANDKIKSMGYHFEYPTYQQGYRELIKELSAA